MLSKELEKALNESFKQARSQRHEYITVEHLLLALLEDSAALRVLNACQADIEALRGDLNEFIDATTPMVSGDDQVDTQPTLGFQRVLQRAVFHVQSSGKAEVSGANVLVAIFSEQESQAVYFLKTQDISRLDIVNYITHGVSKSGEDSDADDAPSSAESELEEGDEAAESPLTKFATNLNEDNV